jgi:hypothetical protein
MNGRYVLLAIVIVMLCWSASAADPQMIVVNKEKINNPSLQQDQGTIISAEPVCEIQYLRPRGLNVKKGDVVQIPVFFESKKETIGNIEFTLLFNHLYELENNGGSNEDNWSYAGDNYKHAIKLLSVETGALTQNSLFDYNIGVYKDMKTGEIDSDSVDIAIASGSGFSGYGSVALLNFEIEYDPKNTADHYEGMDLIIIRPVANSIGGEQCEIDSDRRAFLLWEEPMKGEGNGDGKISVEDAYIALQMALGKVPENLILDMDDNGKVTANDARILLVMAESSQNTLESGTPALEGQGVSVHPLDLAWNQLSPENIVLRQVVIKPRSVFTDRYGKKGATPIQLP